MICGIAQSATLALPYCSLVCQCLDVQLLITSFLVANVSLMYRILQNCISRVRHACVSSMRRLHVQVAVFGIGRLLKPRPTCRGLWLGVLLLWGAAAIILPIIRAEGIRAVFAPWLVRKPAASAHRITRNSSRIALAGADRLR